jgi:Protein kinase domain
VAPTWYYTVLTQMLEALEYLHAELRPLIHRDIRPDNILYNDINHFVLADFTDAAIGHGHAGEFTGPLEYLPPEMYNREEQTEAVDIWSLGVLCLHMLDLVPGVSEEDFCFKKMKERSWCEAMCDFAKYCTRPEVWMMVQMRPQRRSKARQLRRFLQEHPSTQLQRRPASEHLIYLIFKELKQFKSFPKPAIFKAAGEFLRNETATGSVGRSADEARSESEPTESQGRSRPSSGQSGLLRASATLSPTGSEGLGEQILMNSSGAAAKSSPAGSRGAAGSFSSTLHEVPKGPSSSGSTPPLTKPQRRAGASTTSRQPKSWKPAPLALTPDEQRLVDELGSVAPSSSAESKSKTGRQRRVQRPVSPERRKKAAEPSATTKPRSDSGALAGPSSLTINPQPTNSQEEAERSSSINMSSKGLEALTEPLGSRPKSSSVPRGTVGAPSSIAKPQPRSSKEEAEQSSSIEKPFKRSERAVEPSSSDAKPQLTGPKGEAEFNSSAEPPPRRLEDEAEKFSSAASPQSTGSQLQVPKSTSIAKPSPNGSKRVKRPTSSTAKMPPAEQRATTGPESSTSQSTSESAGSKKGEQGSSQIQGITQALEAVKASDEAARARRKSVLEEVKLQSLRPARDAPAVSEQRKSVLKKAEIQASEPTKAPTAAMPPSAAKTPPTAWGKSIAKKSEAQASEPARAPVTAREQQKSAPKNAEAQSTRTAKIEESRPVQRDDVQAPLVVWRGRSRELVQDTARGDSQATGRAQSQPTPAPQFRHRAKSQERPPSESSLRTSAISSSRRSDKPDSTQLTPRIGPIPPRGLSVDAPKWYPGTKTWGLSESEPPKRTFTQAAGAVSSAAPRRAEAQVGRAEARDKSPPRPSEAETQQVKVEKGEGENEGERLQPEAERGHRPSGSQPPSKQSQSQSPSHRNLQMEPRYPHPHPPHHHHHHRPPPSPGSQRWGSYPLPHPPPGNYSGGFYPSPSSLWSHPQAYYHPPPPLLPPSPGSYPAGYYHPPPWNQHGGH